MAGINDRDLGAGKGVDINPGVANPTSSSTHADPLASNFVSPVSLMSALWLYIPTAAGMNYPTSEQFGAGAGPDFAGHQQASRNFKETAGVVEGRPGIIESTNIDPLNETSNTDDGWANVRSDPGSNTGSGGATSTASNLVSGAAGVASGVAKFAYGTAVGDEDSKRAGSDAVFGQ
ncbi:hypothetical protein OF83DRAFT_1073264 [Amylostereum chailletii]|nr:hypothetical protein OF83DRAFT_1073264 [Amylostereum chailletii]